MLQSHCLKQPSAKLGIKIHSWLPKHIHTPVFTTAPWPAHTIFSSSPSRTMLELSEWEGAIYGDSGTKNCSEVLHPNHMYVESSPTTPPCGECAVGRETSHGSLPPQHGPEKAHARKGRGWCGREKKWPYKCTSFKRRSKHAEVKLNRQTRWKNCPCSSPDCYSFPWLLSLKVKVMKTSPFHTSSRTSFTGRIGTSFLVNRDSGLKASEARYNFVTLQERDKQAEHMHTIHRSTWNVMI